MTATTGISSPQSEGASDAVPAKAQAAPQGQDLDAAAVAAWLFRHPQFFQDQPELLMAMRIPHASGKAVSLLERQVALLRERHQQMEAQFEEIIGNARENDVLFEITRMVILDLLRCRDLDTLNKAIEERLKDDFEASAARLVFVSDKDIADESRLHHLPQTAVRTALGELFQKQRTWCGPLNRVQQQLLFKGVDATIVSAAIVPLHLPEDSRVLQRFGQPLLLVGSCNEQHFNSSLDTLFLDFIGEVLTVHLEDLPVSGAA